jgi:hypothetical protein
MTKHSKKSTKQTGHRFSPLVKLKHWWKKSLWHKALLIVCALIILSTSTMYGVARWYIAKHADEPLTFGATFIPDYARQFNLDPQQTMQAAIDELGIKRFRLVSYWKNIEKFPDVYDFSELDWQFDVANKNGAKVNLAIGLRQPRWPECHEPDWIKGQPIEFWYPKLKNFMGKVIERYGNNPALQSYQLENEFFMTVFGICPDHSRWRLEDEFDFVKNLDTDTPVIISRSNNWVGLPLGGPRPDEFAISVYKRVWDKTITKRYFEYPLPTWFYASLAGGGEILTGKNMHIHELQAEAWLPPGYLMTNAPIEEMYKSMNPERLKNRISYGVATGMKKIDLWGIEWWYQMKVQRGEPGLWDTAKSELERYR